MTRLQVDVIAAGLRAQRAALLEMERMAARGDTDPAKINALAIIVQTGTGAAQQDTSPFYAQSEGAE